jgi:hypothetical protein
VWEENACGRREEKGEREFFDEINTVEGHDESDAINYFLMPSPKSKILFLLKPKSFKSQR